MTRNDDPWNGLRPGAIDARRVDQAGQHDFFWIVSAEAEPGLLFRLAPDTNEIKPLPRMRSIDLAYRDVSGARALVLLLKDSDQRQLFANLCENIVAAGESAVANQEALQRSIRRTIRWHHLLRGGSAGVLSLEEQRGLLGELNFLRRLVDLLGARAAIESWKGPIGASKDFELGDCLVEVKARRGAARPYVQISSEDQLSDVDGTRLFLVVTAVDAAIKPDGLTLTDHVSAIDRTFAQADLEAYAMWEEALDATGFDFEDDYSDRRWTIGRNWEFEVSDGFPRIVPPLISGVSAVRYSIGLEACEKHAVSSEDLDHIIAGERVE
jgi:hypothetical protein